MTRLGYIIKKFFGNILGRPMAALGSLLSLFLLFLLFDLIWIGSLTVNNFYDEIVAEIDIEIFLDDTIPDSTVTVIKDALSGLDGIESIEYVSRDDARSKLQDLMGVDLLDGLDNNPLPRSMVISFESNYLNSNNLNVLSRDLQRMAGVTDIFYPNRWLEKAEFTRLLISEALILLGLVISIAVILNSIHFIVLSARTRKDELIQLQLLGAGYGFLALPYILEGIFYALFSATAGWIAIYYSIDLYTFRNIEIILPAMTERIYFCLAATAVGMIGGYLGIRRAL